MVNSGHVPYATAKGGVISLTLSLSKEVAQYGVRVNCVAPAHSRSDDPDDRLTPSLYGVDVQVPESDDSDDPEGSESPEQRAMRRRITVPISCFFMARSMGLDLLAIPVFPRRTFMHTGFQYHVDAGISQPGDLVGKRVGMAEFQQTGSMWARGILAHDFGVAQEKVLWVEQAERLSHGATFYTPPEGVSVERISPEKSLATMLVNQELDAARVGAPRNRADRVKVKPLFEDVIVEGKRFFADHGFIPANHLYAIRGDVYREYPWVALNLYYAFVKAKEIANETLGDRIPTSLVFGGEYMQQTRSAFGDDPFPYGVKPNEKMLQTCIDYCYEQGLSKQKDSLEAIFAPIIMDL